MELIKKIRESVVGDKAEIATPFGVRPLVYADYTASGRSLDFVEDFIRYQVQHTYANTHTEASFTGMQTTALREQARDAIKSSVNAQDTHAVVFAGSGATAAIDKLLRILELERYEPSEKVIFIGPYEHHSNELIWRESGAEIVGIPLNKAGMIDVEFLASKLAEYQHFPFKLASFSAASNVTGVISPIKKISALAHQYGFLSAWDFAAAGPYIAIDVQNSLDDGDNSLDAVFVSPHKFVGGPSTPGVLVVNKQIVNNAVPSVPGGGTVSFVAPDRHTFIDCIERREEGGTPAIIESIRAGIVFDLKDRVGSQTIHLREQALLARAFDAWKGIDGIKVLGGTQNERVGIVSLQIFHGEQQLHYNFVVALLNDVFGIQVRGGCSCAGPYGHALLELDELESKRIEAANRLGDMILRPGWIRLNFSYFLDGETADYLIDAIKWVATNGADFLPYYQFDAGSGTWQFQGQTRLPAVSLRDYLEPATSKARASLNFAEYIAEAQKIIEGARQCSDPHLTQQGEPLRWFVIPSEIVG